MTMTRKELARAVAEAAYVLPGKSADLVDLAFEIQAETLERGEKIKIAGFGNFTVRSKRARRGRNPQTGGEIVISGRKVVTFKPSNVLRKALKQEG